MRKQLSIVLILVSFTLLILPGTGGYSFKADPEELLQQTMNPDIFVSVDRVATLMNNEDEHLQLIDLRSVQEYKQFNIPGSINVPFERFFELHPETWLYNPDALYVFYSNDDLNASYAMVLAKGLGYENCFVMQGGMNEWFAKVMNSTFRGNSITPRENAIFENRKKARQFFTEINSLPDSLKQEYVEAKQQAERKLDGGCN